MADFEQIYDQYFRDVYQFVYSLSRNETLSEEVTQETFFKALKSIDSFKGNCKLSVWLCQIAKNTYFTHLDKQKRYAPEDEGTVASGGNPEEALLKRDETMRIHRALHRLKEPYKEVFTLRVFGELSFAQIGGLFEKSEGWARVTFYRAKQKIQELLKEEG
ncbi:RNA polymerase sigma-70 factor (ECF subfamily) [Fontibacillus phaseoli]|uniref:RNA polymerase sigma-70 factor (ECF subfamily) n=1 Tax=Fontibacillus phaseoli TaxID=1416533 RepID=A0A369B1E3_9BACL|nr:RNA polymerase sigma factor [Fontibacillus phaseoli]RCX15369.1 RNA polymerase sigma-70 factor (ECF subfamily) [Fontibacillus phaseoli]